MSYIKIILSSLLILFALSSCKVYPPVYKRVDNFKIEKLDKDGFKVYGDLVLYNPNKVHLKLNDILMNIELNGKHVLTTGQKQPIHIRPVSEFVIPLNLTIKPDMTLLEGLKNLISIIKTKQVDVTVKGVVVIGALGTKFSIPVDQKEKIDIIKLK